MKVKPAGSNERIGEADAADPAFRAISNDRRRAAITLLDRNGPMLVSNLSERIAAAEYDKPPEHLSAQERKRVYIAMTQRHLGELSDVGMADVDERNVWARPGPLTEVAADYIGLGRRLFEEVARYQGDAPDEPEAPVVRAD